MDYIRTAAGSEVSDQSFRAISSKPNWLLTPLPFSQLRPYHEAQSTSSVKTLSSCVLETISLKFDQFPLESFASLPLHLIRRIIARVRADRNYEEDTYGRVNIHPDETTIWALQALYLPNEADDHVLGLPCVHLLQRMQGHPITLLPTLDIRDPTGLAAPSIFRFLTTISLNISDGPIDDQNIQGLRWCTHLTGLWMQGCNVSDYGITLLASALELPGSKGMCRLRAWSVLRCKAITDKSMKAFAKFPGLVMLDIRETSCTDVAIEIFNRQSAVLFPHPGFQPCTEGLLDLFSIEKTPTEILSYLCSTLMKTPNYTALHIVPSTFQISPHFTPFPDTPALAPTRPAHQAPTYRADGVGVVYGQGVANIADPVDDLRQAIRNLPLAWQIADDESRGIVRKRIYSDWDKDGTARYVRQAWKEEKKPKPKIFHPDKKKKVMKKIEIKGGPKLMMVRMIADGWDESTWGTSVRASATDASSSASQVRSIKAGNLVNDIFGATKVKQSGPFRPTQSSSPASSPPSESQNSIRKPTRPSLNPFRIPSTSSQDIKPLVLKSSTPVLEEDAFTNSQPKRRFGGADTENKRRSGMKMFTINAKK